MDFYCAASKLVVEVDGGVHDMQKEEDAAHTVHLESYGCRVIRFRNEVFCDLPSVLERILCAAKERSCLPLTPPELGAGGS